MPTKSSLLKMWVVMLALIFSYIFGGHAWGTPNPDTTKIEVPLTFLREGLASVGIYNETGELIRSLSFAKPVNTGTEAFDWDGTTDLGLPATPGRYHVKGVEFPQGPKIHYVMKVGISGNPPYLTTDPNSGWGAVHGPPTAVCSNNHNLLGVFEMAESSRETGIQLMDFDGKIVQHFSSLFPFDRRMACTMDEQNIYLALAVSWKPPNRLVIAKYDINGPPTGKILCDIPAGNHIAATGRETGRWQVDVQGLAVQGQRLYIPVTLDNKVVVVDTLSGKILNSANVQSPRGIAMFGGKIYAISGKSIVRLDADGSPTATIVSSDLDDPSGLAIDAHGHLYAADGGPSQQVKVFSQNGRMLKEIGTKGGRPRDGFFSSAGMLDPRGISVTPDGKIWVAEVADDYQELTAWNQDGTRAKSSYNMHWSSGQGRLSPDRTELFFGARVQEVNAGLSSYKVDLEHGNWKPYWHLNQMLETMDQRDVLLGYRPSGKREQDEFNQHEPYLSFEKDMVNGVNGKTYLTGGDFSIWLFDPATKKVKLASLVFCHHVEKMPNGIYQANYDQGPSNWLTWADLNGDGKMSLEETRIAKDPPLLDHVPKISSILLQPDLSIWMLAGFSPKSVYVPTRWFVYRLRPQQVLASGVPIYDWQNLEKVTELHVPDFHGGDRDPNRDITRVQMDSMKVVKDAVYVRLNPSAKTTQHLPGIDGNGWWASRNWRMSPEKFNLKTGEPAWLKLGRRASAHANPGEMYYPGWGLAGSSHGIDFFADTLSQVWAWTDDGLYIGPVYNDNVGTSIYDANSLFVELVGAYVYDIKGKTYILAGDHGISVHELTLPVLTPVDGGTVTLTAEQSANAKAWDPDGPLPGKNPNYIAPSVNQQRYR